MADISKISPDDGSTILNIKDSNAVHWADNAILGARNLYNAYKPKKSGLTPIVSNNGQSINILGTNVAQYNNSSSEQAFEPNITYRVSGDVVINSGVGRIKIEDNGTVINQTDWITSNGHYEFTFNTGNHSSLQVTLFCTGATAQTGDVNYNNLYICLASDTNTTWCSYAMTNKGLTDYVNNTTPLLMPINLDLGKGLVKEISNTDLDNYKDAQVLMYTGGNSSTITNRPVDGAAVIYVIRTFSTTHCRQIALMRDTNDIYTRVWNNVSWTTWAHLSMS